MTRLGAGGCEHQRKNGNKGQEPAHIHNIDRPGGLVMMRVTSTVPAPAR